MNDYAHLRLYEATIRGMRSSRHARPSARRHGSATGRLPALLTGGRGRTAGARTSAAGDPTPAASA